jgi:phage shock protein PspC (stress-responsive transcriptional regulator)
LVVFNIYNVIDWKLLLRIFHVFLAYAFTVITFLLAYLIFFCLLESNRSTINICYISITFSHE